MAPHEVRSLVALVLAASPTPALEHPAGAAAGSAPLQAHAPQEPLPPHEEAGADRVVELVLELLATAPLAYVASQRTVPWVHVGALRRAIGLEQRSASCALS